MAEYDYLNARARGMSARLLSREFFEQLLLSQDESLLIDLLLNSDYEQELRSALSEKRGLEAFMSAVRRRVGYAFGQLRRHAPERPRGFLDLQLNRWDVANVLSVIRGKVTGASPEEILEALLPVGEFSEAQLSELAGEPDVASVVRALTTWNYTFAFAVREAVSVSMGDEPRQSALKQLAQTLNKTYFEWALGRLQGKDANTRIVREQLQLQIDLSNVKNAVDAVRLREAGYEDELAPFVSGGTLDPAFLTELAEADNLETAFEKLDATVFGVAVERGILAFGESRNLAVMERFFEAVVAEHCCKLLRADPLTIGVPLGYLWRRYNEFTNLRIVVRGKRFQMPVNAIREELFLV